MFRYKRKRSIPYWYKLIEENQRVRKYKIYIIILLLINLVLCPIMFKQITYYKNNTHKKTNVKNVSKDKKIINIYNNYISKDYFRKNLKSINYIEDNVSLIFVFNSLSEGDNLIENLNFESNVKITFNDGKYIYYVDI